jgi:methylated-DNA-[protein]-cysteine S-methyltransferase
MPSVARTAPARKVTSPSRTLAPRWPSSALASPVGPLTLYASGRGLRALRLPEERHPLPHEAAATVDDPDAEAILATAARELTEYFAGARRDFTVPLDPEGTPFQRAVWTMLSTIPYAATWSYGQLARAIERPAASRAVGAANGRNPLPIIVPCHRVIGSDGAATGYGGGLPTKRWLLDHEAAVVAGHTAR